MPLFYWYENVVFGGWLTATIKANESGTELWVSTFHPSNAKEVKRMKKDTASSSRKNYSGRLRTAR